MSRSPEWTFLSNHGHVLVALARDQDARIRDLADAVGITDRAVQDILGDLVDGGYVVRTREGRRNHYRLVRRTRLRHPLEARTSIGAFLDVVAPPVG
ncbi:MAG: helix-turn-helix transcriptional regulator [Phycicoccus sp.]